MTTPSSGVFKFTDLREEFGGPNPINLSEYYSNSTLVPAGQTGALGAIPSSSTLNLSQLRTSTAPNQFFALFGLEATTTSTNGFADVAVSPTGKIIGVGSQYLRQGSYADNFAGSHTVGLVVKYNTMGNIIWQKRINPPTTDDNIYLTTVAIDSSGNIYATGQFYSSDYSGLIIKFDSAGNVLWQKKFGNGTNYTYIFSQCIDIDSSGNVYVSGMAEYEGTDTYKHYGVSLAKWDTNGNLQWQTALKIDNCDVNDVSYPSRLAVDASGNCFVLTAYQASTVVWRHQNALFKVNSSGTLQWQRVIGNPGVESFFTVDVAVDSSGNAYYVAWSDSSANLLVKYNTSGTLQWQKSTGMGGTRPMQGLRVDSSNNIYVTYDNSSVGVGCTKFNSTPAVVWSRKLTYKISGSLKTMSGTSYYDSVGDNIIFAGTLSDDGQLNKSMLYKSSQTYFGTSTLPKNVGNWFIENNVGGSVSTTSFTEAAGTMTVWNPALTSSTTTLSVTEVNITNTKTVLT